MSKHPQRRHFLAAQCFGGKPNKIKDVSSIGPILSLGSFYLVKNDNTGGITMRTKPASIQLLLATLALGLPPRLQAGPLLAEQVAALVAPLYSASPAPRKASQILVGITHHGRHQFFAFGSPAPTSTDVWEIGSNTKVFTSLLLALDANASGSVETFLARKLVDFIPGFRDALNRVPIPANRLKATITLAQIATHSSGLPFQIPPSAMSPYSDDQAQFYRLLARPLAPRLLASSLPLVWLAFTPGTAYHYSNPGFSLLGHALSNYRGIPYADRIEKEVLAPLGLSHSGFLPAGHYLQGYAFQGGARTPQPIVRVGRVNESTGGLRSTGEDMLSYIDSLMSPPAGPLGEAIRLVKKVRLPYPCRNGESPCGIGLGLESYLGMRWKDGQTHGFHSIIAFDEARDVGMFLVANQMDTSEIHPVAFRVLNAVASYDRGFCNLAERANPRESRALASSPSSYLVALYQKVLGRTPDYGEPEGWLRSAPRLPLDQVAKEFLCSEEKRREKISNYYRSFLGRSESVWENDAWFRSRQSWEEMTIGFLGSEEYFRRSGGTHVAFVTRLYHDLLGRAPDTSSAHWVDRLDSGFSRQRVIREIQYAGGSEFHRRLINNFYTYYLGRAADPGAEFWASQLHSGAMEWEHVLNAILASEEFLTWGFR